MGTTIFLADDNVMVRERLRLLLESQGDFTVIGEAANGSEAVLQIIHSSPHVAIFDIVMPELDGLEAATQIRKICPTTQVIIFSWHADSSHIIRAFQVGVSGYLLKGTTGSEVIPAIRAVEAGQRYLSQRIVSMVKKGNLSLPDWVEF